MDNCRSQELPMDEKTNLFNYIILKLMSFMTLEVLLFRKNQNYYLILTIFLFDQLVT